MPVAKNDFRLPRHYYPAVAPLPVPMAEYLLNRLMRAKKLNPSAALPLLVQEIEEKSRIAFFAMDIYVRNQHKPSEYKLTSSWVRETIGIYHPIPPATFTEWTKKRAIRRARWGRPTANSTAAVYTTLMIMEGEKDIFPESIPADEPEWYCYVQRTPRSPIEVMAKEHFLQLGKSGHASALGWTHWIGANWEGWHFVGEREGELGAITFAGIGAYRDHLWYDVTLDDLLRWVPDAQALAQPFAGNSLVQVQSLTRPILDELAKTRFIARREGEKPS